MTAKSQYEKQSKNVCGGGYEYYVPSFTKGGSLLEVGSPRLRKVVNTAKGIHRGRL